MNIITTIRTLLGLVPSTEKAIAGFNKAAAKLEAVVAHEATVIDALAGKIEKLEDSIASTAAARLDAFARRDRAKTIADRVAALIG
ncbi:hypothetical protein X747_14590 [Mesorhizobium sp. LNJC384A00]|uniref:hypothetical protein n=1 Tax=Mesorhizobium sp. LNJC384A00 TaxID=1287268 RepID=UPI0003CE86E7|nr:hypothetical protein [Mesorhizobium sp. LNJC384A00]ESY42022.1 hypothetical protein X747_14590 [Mesorhizobium sp. LNJC384A00]